MPSMTMQIAARTGEAIAASTYHQADTSSLTLSVGREADITITLPADDRAVVEHIEKAVREAYEVASGEQPPAVTTPAITDAEVEAAHAAWADLYYDGCQWRETFGEATLAGQRAHIRAALEAAARVSSEKRRAA